MAHYYNEMAKTYIIAFSKLFSNVHVKRYTSAGVIDKDIKVPLVYATKSKLSYLLQANTDTSAASVVLPVMSFNIEAIDFDAERKMNSLNKHNVDETQQIYEGMPWNFTFELTIRTKYQADYWQILEQVLYLFKPELSLDVITFTTFVRDTMVTLESVSLENETELSQDEESERDFRASIGFKLKGFIYPTITDDTIIEHIDMNIINSLDEQIANISHDWVDPDIITTLTEG